MDSFWSLAMRSFWKTRFINPPEVGGQMWSCSVTRKENDDEKVLNSLI
jgi:hypothetical protein